MLYHLYEFGQTAISPARAAANSTRFFMRNPFNPLSYTNFGRSTAAAAELLERTTRRYKKPEFNIKSTMVKGQTVAVSQEIVWKRPFCHLIHFRKDIDSNQAASLPRILMVAPLSGHYATLLRGTVEAMLPFAEIYITDWIDARLVPQRLGNFDLDDYIDYMIDMISLFHGDVHVMGVCQPSVPVLAAIALMEADDHPATPRSIILKGGPIDTRVNPTAVNNLAEQKGTNWFRRTVITQVPWPNAGHGRLVYPGFLQLTGFMMMNLDRHVNAHKELFENLIKGDGDSVEKHKEFYDEYLAVMDLTAEYYLQTVEQVFVKHQLPKGEMFHRGRLVDLTAIRKVALMTIEGEKDDITGLGQCEAAHSLCSNLPRSKKRYYTQLGVGHYGIFNGSRFRHEIVPRVVGFMTEHDIRGGSLRWIMSLLSGDPGMTDAPKPVDDVTPATETETQEAARLSCLPAKPALKIRKGRALAQLSGANRKTARAKHRIR